MQQRSLALRMPSLRLPFSFNFLINPDHPEFSDSRIEALGPLVLDERIQALLDCQFPGHPAVAAVPRPI